ncbi:hypothetical protein, variant [Blastomyces dermatitidis ER-3]|uniref:Argonaute complex, subunit Arb1 n=2 Tax=Ajellomyces dermatitidis TaxID=5039 RepID=F2TEN0_AJEDA|nr:uncharacterized protein BDCG_04042 [Blastomyces dermatitidis ER-3]XP_045280722.1 hypothetical protein, variant [Blastomyces dermatitidis ER-3]EGE81665.2 hypothetical protein BDDG_04608 [Blastomyces dermatitidis ATCC 18188]EQL31461.1 hypothetical protein BDFG_06274 [Blastomyces dermatitidis ATCC 26199]EQL31462.1 hypothetical protein, variant [Blastomyces dermatitidis ATCC 26199]KMW67577.1 hypothetical protein, variant [Blastomyces dermatitidis ATCC 18188]OAT00994.1 hypothetical protein BDCG
METKPIAPLPVRDKQTQGSSDCQQDIEARGPTNTQTARPNGDNNGALEGDVGVATKNGEEEPDTLEGTAEVTVAKKKKKRNKKSRGKNKGSGFEEYVADGPITVAEYEENKNRYDRSLPAKQRLETAIQRFQAKRSMDSDRRSVFTKYMSYGGVDVGPKMFEGNDQRDLMDKDAEDILTATAQASVPENRVGWAVDFEAVAKGFLSSVLPLYIGLETEALVDMATGTIRNFLNYILLHDVCPEYTENILAARAVCDTAKVELWKAQQTNCWAPGHFNMACSTLFGGYFYGFYTGGQEWSNEVGAEGMEDSVARKVVKFALAGAGSYEQAVRFRDLANSNELKATCVDENGFEVTAIAPVDGNVRDFYKQHAPDLQPIGKLRAKPWRNPGLSEEDLPPGQVCGTEPSSPSVADEYEFFVDESMLQFCFVGMKVDTTVWELNCGLHYFDNVMAIYCSFYTILLNESMIGWKEPRDLRGDDEVWYNPGAAKGEDDGAAGASEEVDGDD